MDYRNIKVHVPTPEISKLVQEKLFEEGCRWYSGEGVKNTDRKYLYVFPSNILTWEPHPEYFHQQESKQVHYLQVLAGDDSGVLFRYYEGGAVVYAVGETHYWVDRNNGKLYSAVNRCGTNPSNYTLLDVNEEEIMQDNSNEMPALEAGKHVVRDDLGNLYLVIYTEKDGPSGIGIGGARRWYRNIQDTAHITEIHHITYAYSALVKNAYDESTLIWKRDDKAAEAREQYDELQRQIKQLQEQADKLGEKL